MGECSAYSAFIWKQQEWNKTKKCYKKVRKEGRTWKDIKQARNNKFQQPYKCNSLSLPTPRIATACKRSGLPTPMNGTTCIIVLACLIPGSLLHVIANAYLSPGSLLHIIAKAYLPPGSLLHVIAKAYLPQDHYYM